MKTSWLNKLYKENITFQGQHKIVGGRFFGVTDGGVLLKIETQTFRDGSFTFLYGMAPLIVPLRAVEEKYKIYICDERYAAIEYSNRRAKPADSAQEGMYLNPHCAADELPLLERRCAVLLRMIDHDFLRCDSTGDFSAICMERFARLTEEERQNLAVNYPEDCPVEGDFFGTFGSYIYVNTLLGNYDKALARVRGEKYRMRLLNRASLKRGDCTQEEFEAETAKNLAKYRDIIPALLNHDMAACEVVLERNYQQNRQILFERLGFILPKDYRELCE